MTMSMRMRMRMPPPPPMPMPTPMLSPTHRLLLLPTIITLFILIAGANAFTHPITATNRVSLLSHTSSTSRGYHIPPASSSASSVLLQHDHHLFEQCHRQRRWDRSSLLVLASSSSPSSSSGSSQDAASSSSSSNNIVPKTFREGEIIGLRYMQDGMHEEALKAFQKAMTLPGSRTDILRTSNISGPSPVGGSTGGSEGRLVQTLDEFEYQAAHYNMACAHATLNNLGEAILNLQKAFEYGFDNYATVRADPDLRNLDGVVEFERLMEKVDPKKRFRNPFDVFGK